MKFWTTKLSVSSLPSLLKPKEAEEASQLPPMQIYTKSHRNRKLLGMTPRTQGKLLLHEAESHSGIALLTVVHRGPHEEQVTSNTHIITITYDIKMEYPTPTPAIFHHHLILHSTKSKRELF